MVIYLDNTIFNLQKQGFESMQWADMIRGLMPLRDAELRYIEYRNAITNEERFRLDIARRGHLYIMRNMWLTRHLAVRIDGYSAPFIFHSSTCRVCDNPYAVNIITLNPGFKPSFLQSHALRRCNYIICTSHTICNTLSPSLRCKSVVISTKKSSENIARATMRLYRRALLQLRIQTRRSF